MEEVFSEQDVKETQQLWHQKYGQTVEATINQNRKTKLQLDPAEATLDRLWYPKFQSYLKKYHLDVKDDKFWKKHLKDYEKFLYLVAKKR